MNESEIKNDPTCLLEKEITQEEVALGLEQVDYESFVYSLKRFGFNKTHLTEEVLILAAEELKLDLRSLVKDESTEGGEEQKDDSEIVKMLKS